jgi:hypothetical protein
MRWSITHLCGSLWILVRWQVDSPPRTDRYPDGLSSPICH